MIAFSAISIHGSIVWITISNPTQPILNWLHVTMDTNNTTVKESTDNFVYELLVGIHFCDDVFQAGLDMTFREADKAIGRIKCDETVIKFTNILEFQKLVKVTKAGIGLEEYLHITGTVKPVLYTAGHNLAGMILTYMTTNGVPTQRHFTGGKIRILQVFTKCNRRCFVLCSKCIHTRRK